MATSDPLANLLASVLSLQAAPGSPLSADQQAAFDHGIQQVKLRRWLYLDATPVLIARLQTAQARHQEAQRFMRAGKVQDRYLTLLRLEEQVADGLERDAAQVERPEGCWCFGFGGRDRAVVLMRDGTFEETWTTCCPYCPEGQQAAERKRALEMAYREGHSVLPSGGWTYSGIPAAFQKFRLETSPLCERYFDLITRLLDVEQGSWYFCGPVGVGKTGLAVGLAWVWRERYRKPILFVTVPNLLTEFRSTYGRQDGPTEQDIIRKYADVPFLTLDDLGAEHLTTSGQSWVADRLFQIVGHRHSNGLPTVFTSNLDLVEAAARIGDRLAWRIAEACGSERVVFVDGPNLREG